MNCQEIREQLDEALDDQCVISGQNDDSRYTGIVSHVESCADCRVLYEEHLLMGSALATWIPRRPIVDLTDRVIETARREGLVLLDGSPVATEFGRTDVLAGRSALDTGNVVSSELPNASPTRRTVLPTIVTAALVLVAVAIVFRGKPGEIVKKDEPPLHLPTDRQTELIEPPQDQVADIGHLVADAQSAWRGITSRVTHQASGFSVFVPDFKNELGISGEADSAERDREANSSDHDVDSRNQSEPSAVDRAFEFLFKDDDSGGTLTI